MVGGPRFIRKVGGGYRPSWGYNVLIGGGPDFGPIVSALKTSGFVTFSVHLRNQENPMI